MTNNNTVTVDAISKIYRLHGVSGASNTLSGFISSISSRRDNVTQQALDNISFKLDGGDRLGIVGPNGAGKTTLLKVLAKITYPTSGTFHLRGKTASLLEIGTGFHPELTGRENIFLNGAILGMKRGDIRTNLSDIIEFSETNKYIDQPLKHYSTGMQMRLGFAVAAFLNADILLIDEVLAVGDYAFQQRCINKIQQLSSMGRTILFVSHNFALIEEFCNKGLLLINGTAKYFGPVDKTINRYTSSMSTIIGNRWTNTNKTDMTEPAYIKKAHITDAFGKSVNTFKSTDEIRIVYEVVCKESVKDLKIGFDLTRNGQIIFRSQNTDTGGTGLLTVGHNRLVGSIPGGLLNSGEYLVSPLVSIHCLRSLTAQTQSILRFEVDIDPSTSKYTSLLKESNHPGGVFPLLTWEATK